MALTLTPTPYQTVLDSTGVAVSGAKITTYLAGTTTAASTYTTSVGDVANANPIIADSAGRFVAYLSAGASYKFVITDSADVAVDEQDNILSVPGSSVNLDLTVTVGEAVAAGEVCYISATGDAAGTAGLWYLADADNDYSSTTAVEIGIAVSAIAINTSGTMRVAGEATTATSTVDGTKYYVSATAGAITSSAPTNSRLVGIAQTTSSLILNANTLTIPVVVSQGGTGLATLTSASVIIGAGTGTPTFVAPGTSGNVLSSTGSAWSSTAPSTPESDLGICEGRLTLTSATPVTTADVTGGTTLYWALYGGSRVSLYTGSAWSIETVAELSISVPSTTDTVYDAFIDYNGGSPALAVTAWSSATGRATSLTTQNGVLVQTGNLDWRYVGSFRTTDSSGECADALAHRFVWNYYHRIDRAMEVLEATNNWAYTVSTIRQANGSTSNQLAFIVGVAEDAVTASVHVVASNTTAGQSIFAGVGLDSTSAFASATRLWHKTAVGGYQSGLGGQYVGYPGLGYHFLSWLERGNDSGTTTWIGDDGAATTAQGGIQGMMRG
jgi:hypothetical protein